ncbi:hypothetical protein EAF00_003864 [Botryotinia globosa]|nr:hypothetical protein EAF00_003864 [Botryotinia globosa]
MAVVNLDFDARIPIPFSIFPSSYRSDVAAQPIQTTETHVEGEITLHHHHERVGREGREEDAQSLYSQHQHQLQHNHQHEHEPEQQHHLPPPPQRQEFVEEEVRITREEDRRSEYRPSSRREEEVYIREEGRPEHKHKHHSASFDINTPHHHRHFEASFERDSDRHHKHSEVNIELPRREHHHHHHQRRPSSEVDFQLERQRQPRHYEPSEVDTQFSAPQKSPTETNIDFVERQYRSRTQPSYKEDTVIVDPPKSRVSEPRYIEETRVTETTIVPAPRPTHSHKAKSTFHEDKFEEEVRVKQPRTPARSTFTEEVRERELVKYTPPAPKSTTSTFKPVNLEMGYYDDEGNYHSLRGGYYHGHGKTLNQDPIDSLDLAGAPAVAAPKQPANTVTIPCHHIRMGDLLMLQGRPCQVIRITTSAATGQHRYLGVDLFTRQLNEESSFIANPSPSVVVQTMLGPVFKQYRVLDLQDHSVVAMTETGDVKQAIPVLDQSNLWTRLKEAFEGGRGSIRIMVVADGGREIAVDMKTVHGSRL